MTKLNKQILITTLQLLALTISCCGLYLIYSILKGGESHNIVLGLLLTAVGQGVMILVICIKKRLNKKQKLQ
jgi:predicted Co/Zn/Cd cation transporter (cation efflux family)